VRPYLRAAVALIAILVAELVALYPGVFTRGEILSSVALAYGMAPWRGHRPQTEAPLRGNPVLSDDMVLFTPWDEATRAALRACVAPLWSPASGCGMPLLANNQSAVLAPTQALRLLWDSPRARTFGLLLKVLIAGAGMLLLLARLGATPGAALVGALAWANAAAVTLWLLYPLAETAAWFSWVVLGVFQVLGVGRPPRRAGVVTVALGGAAMLLAGHLPTALQLTVALAGSATVLIVARRERLRMLPRLLLAALFAGALAAPQILPTLSYIQRSHALAMRGGPTPASSIHLPVTAAWSWLVPRGFGSPETIGYSGPLNFNEATASVGLAALVLAALALILAPGRKTLALATLAGGCTLIGYGFVPALWLLAKLPVLRWVASQRFLILAQWAVAALAAFGIDSLGKAPRRRALFAALTVASLAFLAISLHPIARGPESDPRVVFGSQAVVQAAAEGAVIALVLVLGALGWRRCAVVGLAAATLVSGFLLADGFNPTIPAAAVPGPTDATNALEVARGGGRALPIGWVMRPNTGILAGVPTVTGIDDLIPERYHLFTQVAGLSQLDRTRTVTPAAAALLRRAGATVVLADRAPTGSGVHAIPGFEGPHLWAATLTGAHPISAWYPATVAVAGPGEAFTALAENRLADDDTVLIEGGASFQPAQRGARAALALERPSPNRMTVAIAQPADGVVVVRELADPGWRVSVDGMPRQRLVADGMFLAVNVPSGAHRIVFEYQPAEFVAGATLAGVALLALAAWLLVPRYLSSTRRKATAPA